MLSKRLLIAAFAVLLAPFGCGGEEGDDGSGATCQLGEQCPCMSIIDCPFGEVCVDGITLTVTDDSFVQQAIERLTPRVDLA